MSEKNVSPNQPKSLQELSEIKSQMLERKAQLEALKAQGEKSWTKEQQTKLDKLVLALVDIDDEIEAATPSQEVSVAGKKEDEYVVSPSEKNMVHLELVYGRRFDSNTGKEISSPFVQTFTQSEWRLFKQSFSRLGYVIKSVKHDPTGEAAQFVVTTKN